MAQARQLFEILNDRELQEAFGARDAWQVIERVSRDLGGARNVARYRKQAEAARQIFDWLADYTAGGGTKDDAQVVSAAEQWLGTADVMRIDLAAVTRKYIGETEKNLSALFDAAEKPVRYCCSTKAMRCSAGEQRSRTRTTATRTSMSRRCSSGSRATSASWS